MKHVHHPIRVSTTLFAIAVSINLLFTLFEGAMAWRVDSVSLFADAVHNLGDVLGLLFAWFADWLLTCKTKARYSYGYRRTTILAAFFNAMLLIIASLGIAYQSFYRLFEAVSVHEVTVIIVAAVGTVVNGGTALLFLKEAHTDLNIKGVFLHLAYDALISVGVVVAAGLMLLTGWHWLDPVIGFLIVIIILWGTWDLLMDSIDMMLDAVPRHIDQSKVARYLSSLPGVVALHDLHIWGLSTKEIALTAHLVIPDRVLDNQAYAAINRALKAQFSIDHVTLQVEKSVLSNPCNHCDE